MAPLMQETLIDPSTQKTSPVYPLSIESLDSILEYHSHEDGLSNSIRAKVSLPAGSLICHITAHSPVPEPAWSSVQTGPNSHIELNSGLVYANHSCDPNVEFRLWSPDNHGQYPRELPYPSSGEHTAPAPGKHGIAGELRVVSHRALQAGEDLCFFYPSSEWDSAKPFECLCNAADADCLGSVQGAKYLSQERLDKYYVNPHIWHLVRKRDGTT